MKKKLLLLPFVGVLVYIGVCSYTNGAAVSGGVDGTGATNAAGCSCHGISATTTVALELDSAGVAVTSYVGGGSYTIKITGTNTSTRSLPRFGFQIAAVNVAGAGSGTATDAGTLASTGLPASCRFTSAATSGLPINVVEHSAPIAATSGTGGSGTTYVESIGWTAPAAGTGSIKLYGAINAVNFDGTDTGDAANNNSITITEYTAPPTLEPITGTFTVCTGSATPLSSTYSGGTWSCTPTFVATVSASGIVSGLTQGVAVVSYNEGTAGIATATVTVVGAPIVAPVTSTSTTVCPGDTTRFTDVVTGGVWSSGTPSVAVVGSGTGIVTGVSGGTAIISYTSTNACSSTTRTKTITVNPLPVVGALTGGPGVCVGSAITLSDTTGGGTWLSSNDTNATVSGGTVTGLIAGTDTISYGVTNGCGTSYAKEVITVSTTISAGTITGASTLCQGDSVTLSDTVAGGTWGSTDISIATVDSNGVVTGISGGTSFIFYTVSNGCGAASASAPVTVNGLPSVGTISGTASICAGVADTLTDTASGGTWSASNSSAVITTGGVVVGLFTGADTISYSDTNSCGASAATFVVSVTAASAGTITGDTSVCVGKVAVLTDSLSGGTWSITNDTALISGTDIHSIVTGIYPGTDTVFYTVSGSCGVAVSSFILDVLPANACWATGVTNVTNAISQFKVYPNPSTGLFTIDIPETSNAATIVITDVMGNTVQTKAIGNTQSMQPSIDLSGLAAGNYILKVNTGDNTYREKVTIMK